MVNGRVLASWFGLAPRVELVLGKRGSSAASFALGTSHAATDREQDESDEKQAEDNAEADDQFA